MLEDGDGFLHEILTLLLYLGRLLLVVYQVVFDLEYQLDLLGDLVFLYIELIDELF